MCAWGQYNVNVPGGSGGYTIFSDNVSLSPNDLEHTTLQMLSPTAELLYWNPTTQGYIVYKRIPAGGGWTSNPTITTGEAFYCIDPEGAGVSIPFTGGPGNLTQIASFTPATEWYFLGSQIYHATPSTYNYNEITGYPNPGVTGVSLYRANTSVLATSPLPSAPFTDPAQWNEYWYDGSNWHPSTPAVNLGEAVWIGPSSCAIQGTVTKTGGQPFANCEVALSDGQFTFTDANGNYRFSIPAAGEYTVTLLPPCGWTAVTGPQGISATCPGPNIVPPFTAQPSPSNKPDLAVTVIYVPDPGYPSSPCPNDTGSYYVYYYNKCAISPTKTPTLQVTLSPHVTYGYSGGGTPSWSQVSGPPATPGIGATPFQVGQTLSWTLGPLTAGTIGVIQIPIKVTATINQVLTTIATINPIPGDARPSDNKFTSTIHAKCSFDPNSKIVEPEGCGPTGLINNQPLTYTIQFQNVGTAPAFQVVVTDQLDPSLDPTTLQILGASANYVLGLNGNQMTWTFPNIYLQDATDDLQASYGFITYQVQPLAGLADGTVITNQASIVFDSNPPVLTDTTTNTITSATLPSADFTVTPVPGSADATNNFTYTGGTVGATFLWDFGSNAIPPTSTDMNPLGVVFPTDGLTTVNLQVSNGDCTTTPASYLLNVGLPVLNITPTDTNQFVLSWQGDGYSLQQTTVLTNPVPWQTISVPLTQVGATYFTPDIAISNVTTFFRLTDHP